MSRSPGGDRAASSPSAWGRAPCRICAATSPPRYGGGRTRPSTGAGGSSCRGGTPPRRPVPQRCAPPSRQPCWPATGSARCPRRTRRGSRRSPSSRPTPPTPPRPTTVPVAAPDPAAPAVVAAAEAGRVSAESVAWARDLVNTPSNVKNPAWLAEQAVDRLGGRPHVTVTVLGPEELRAGGFGGVLAVGSGSATPPRVVVASYRRPTA